MTRLYILFNLVIYFIILTVTTGSKPPASNEMRALRNEDRYFTMLKSV